MPGRCDRLVGARIRGRGHFHTGEDQRIFFSFAKIEEIKQRHGYLFSLQSRGVFRTPSAGSSSFSIRDEILTREGSFASFGIIYLSRITTLGYPATFGQKSELALGKAFGRRLSTRPDFDGVVNDNFGARIARHLQSVAGRRQYFLILGIKTPFTRSHFT
jgi:hypothetical protein